MIEGKFMERREIDAQLRHGLNEINKDGNWLKKYRKWSEDKDNQFDALLIINDPFNLNVAGDSIAYDKNNQDCVFDFDISKISSFLSLQIENYKHTVKENIGANHNPEEKLSEINEYFDFIEKCQKSTSLSLAKEALDEAAEKNYVLRGNKTIDLFIVYKILLENYRNCSVDSIYLLLIKWRITKKDTDLMQLIDSIIEYIRSYFFDFENDLDMHLNDSLEDKSIIQKLNYLQNWIERITIHIGNIVEEYKNRKWIAPIDLLVDKYVLVNQISCFEMLKYKVVYASDDDDTVRQKAVCNHGYGVWIKSADIIECIYDIVRILDETATDNDLVNLDITREALLELDNNMLEIRDQYKRNLFEHRAYYENSRKSYDIKVIETQENDAMQTGDSIESITRMFESCLEDDINKLVISKQEYLQSISPFVTKQQEQLLDEVTQKIVEKLKSNIEKESIYKTLYDSTTDDFKKYSDRLLQYPDIFSTLVSAEYLYQQYVDGKKKNDKFDYSCISIMYYMALEDFVNKLLYTPYAELVLNSNVSDVEADAQHYITGKKYYFDLRSKSYKTSVEIGNLGHLLNGLKTEIHLQKFIEKRYRKLDLNGLIDFGNKLENVAPRRNEAAHGGNVIPYNRVCEDKKEVFDESNDNYRGLIFMLLELLFR
jgi:hypothetical protein